MPAAKGKGRGGRPTKLTPALAKRLATLIAQGQTRAAAAEATGIGERTLFTWLAKGRAAKSGQFRQLWQALTRAEAEAEQRHVKTILEAAKEDWRAAAWWLERRRPESWAKVSAPIAPPRSGDGEGEREGAGVPPRTGRDGEPLYLIYP